MTTATPHPQMHAPTDHDPPRELTPAEEQLLNLHRALHPELYDEDHEFHEWTTETLEVIADAVRRACRELEIPGFVNDRPA